MHALTRRTLFAVATSLLANSPWPAPATTLPSTRSLYFYDDVDAHSCLALRLALEHAGLDDDAYNPIEVHIQSNGGSLTAALALCDYIEAYPKPIHTFVEGSVASAASLMAACGSVRYMSKSSTLLLHQPSITLGNTKHNDLQDESYNMQLMYEIMLDMYGRHCTADRSTLRDLIENERVLGAGQAKEYGLVDVIV